MAAIRWATSFALDIPLVGNGQTISCWLMMQFSEFEFEDRGTRESSLHPPEFIGIFVPAILRN
jgi:hypothetical protein